MKNSSKKPSKRIIYLGIGALVVVVIIFILKNHTASLVLGEKSISSNTLTGVAVPPAPDRDADGLSDSAEINIWHTDPDNIDTDSDGTSDGDEVNQGRDPAKAGPDDQLSAGDPRISAAIQTTVAIDNSNSGNLTQNLSKNFFTSYLTAQDQSGSVSNEDQANLIQNAISNTPSSTPVVKYDLDSLNVFVPANKDEVKAYGNDFALIYQKDSANYFNIQNPNYDQTAKFYLSLSNDLSKMRVPKAAASLHLEIINDYNQMYAALQDLNNFQNDPLKGTVAVRTFEQSHSIVLTYYIKIANYFKNNAIIFTKDEPGSMWNGL